MKFSTPALEGTVVSFTAGEEQFPGWGIIGKEFSSSLDTSESSRRISER
jgi:hypothetical protein